VFENAIRAAVGQRGVAVLVIPGDLALRTAPDRGISPTQGLLPPAPVVRPDEAAVNALAEMLNSAMRVTLFCGRGCAGPGFEESDGARPGRQGVG
jgi:pyruvate dehydrogenase (quinone)